MKKIIILIFSVFVFCSVSGQKTFLIRLDGGMGSDRNLLFNFSYARKVQPKLFLGVGAGLNSSISSFKKGDVRGDVLLIPMFVEAQFTPFSTVFSPFISMQAGGENAIAIRHIDRAHSVVENDYKLVGYIAPSIGVRLRVVSDFALRCKFSSHFRRASAFSVSQHIYSFSVGMEF